MIAMDRGEGADAVGGEKFIFVEQIFQDAFEALG